MTPAARYAAAIGVLDQFLDGEPAEKLLSNWARGNRYAGSKDRAAVRDIVFDCLRNLRSYQWVAGFSGGRALAVGHCLALETDPDDVFGQSTYAPESLSEKERSAIAERKDDGPEAIRLDLPDWLLPVFQSSLKDGVGPVAASLKTRAPVDLRVNLVKASAATAQDRLSAEDIDTLAVGDCPTALRVTRNPRRVAGSQSFSAGIVELQDAASQAVVDFLEPARSKTILDYCAGGGGKSLAMAALAPESRITAYDANSRRLEPLKERAVRAGVRVQLLKDKPNPIKGTYDLVLTDVPCSGSGSWRRNPEGKWRLSAERLAELTALQEQILTDAAKLVASGGRIGFATCSVLDCENSAQVERFLSENPEWTLLKSRQFMPGTPGDGFYVAVLQKS